MVTVADVTAARALVAGVVVPTVAGAAASRVVAALDGDDHGVLLRGVTVVYAIVVVVAYGAAAWATARLTRGRCASSTLAQPALVFAALRVAAWCLLVAGFAWAPLRQPLVAVAVAVIDAAAVATALLVVGAASESNRAGAGAGAALAWVVYRVGGALAPLVLGGPLDARAHAAVALVVVAMVAVVFARAARRWQGQA